MTTTFLRFVPHYAEGDGREWVTPTQRPRVSQSKICLNPSMPLKCATLPYCAQWLSANGNAAAWLLVGEMMTEVSSPTTLSLALLIILATTTASGMYHHFISLPQYEWPQPFRDSLLAAFAGATGYRPEANGQNHHNGVGCKTCRYVHGSLLITDWRLNCLRANCSDRHHAYAVSAYNEGDGPSAWRKSGPSNAILMTGAKFAEQQENPLGPSRSANEDDRAEPSLIDEPIIWRMRN